MKARLVTEVQEERLRAQIQSIEQMTAWIESKPAEAPTLLGGSGICPKRLTLITGDTGTGKTTLSAQLAIAVATGTDWLGHAASKPGRVLWLYKARDVDTAQACVWQASTRIEREKMRLATEGGNILPGGRAELSGIEMMCRVGCAKDAGLSLIVIDRAEDFVSLRDHEEGESPLDALTYLEWLAAETGAAVVACMAVGNRNGYSSTRARALVEGVKSRIDLTQDRHKAGLHYVKSSHGWTRRCAVTFGSFDVLPRTG